MQFLVEIVSSEGDSFSNKMMIQKNFQCSKQYLENKVTAGVPQVLE